MRLRQRPVPLPETCGRWERVQALANFDEMTAEILGQKYKFVEGIVTQWRRLDCYAKKNEAPRTKIMASYSTQLEGTSEEKAVLGGLRALMRHICQTGGIKKQGAAPRSATWSGHASPLGVLTCQPLEPARTAPQPHNYAARHRSARECC